MTLWRQFGDLHPDRRDPVLMRDVVGVVGAGTMGSGIAQVAALAGHPVLVRGQPGGCRRARGRPRSAEGIRKLAKREVISGAEADAAAARVGAAAELDGLSGCVVVVEAIAEDLAAKARAARGGSRRSSRRTPCWPRTPRPCR